MEDSKDLVVKKDTSQAAAREQIERSIKNISFDFKYSKELPSRWLNNPIYQPSELKGVDPKSSLYQTFNDVVYNHVFEGKPPEENGYVRTLQRRGLTPEGNSYSAAMIVYRNPIMENPSRPQDYIYYVRFTLEGLPIYTAPDIQSGFVEENDEKRFVVIGSPLGTYTSPFNLGFYDQEALEKIISGFHDYRSKEILPQPSSSLLEEPTTE